VESVAEEGSAPLTIEKKNSTFNSKVETGRGRVQTKIKGGARTREFDLRVGRGERQKKKGYQSKCARLA